MAWPKGKPRSVSKAPKEEVQSTRFHRQICALRVREIPIPRDLRIHDYMPLGVIARKIRKEMAAAGANDSEVEAYVAKYVPAH